MESNGYTKIKNNLITSSELDPYEFRIIVYLISLNRNNIVYPSINTISTNTLISKRAVIKKLEDLEKKGYLIRESRSIGKGKKVSNSYLINEDVMLKKIKKEINTEVSEEVESKVSDIDNKLLDYDWLNDISA